MVRIGHQRRFSVASYQSLFHININHPPSSCLNPPLFLPHLTFERFCLFCGSFAVIYMNWMWWIRSFDFQSFWIENWNCFFRSEDLFSSNTETILFFKKSDVLWHAWQGWAEGLKQRSGYLEIIRTYAKSGSLCPANQTVVVSAVLKNNIWRAWTFILMCSIVSQI